MSVPRKPYRIDYTDFAGRTVVKVWRAKAPCYMRSKALAQSNCRTLGPVTEISEEEFEKWSATQVPAKPMFCNHRHA